MNTLNDGAAQVELSERILDVIRVGCKFSRVKSIERQTFHGRSARAIAGGKLGHAGNTQGLSDDELIGRAIEAAQVGAPTGLTFPGATVSSNQVDPALALLSESDLRAMAEEILIGIGQGRREVVIELEVRKVREEVRLSNSSGGQIGLSRAWLEGDAWVERHSGDEVFVVFDNFSSARVDGAHREFARRMARRLRWADKPAQPVPGPQSVVLSPSAFASLLRPMLFRLNGMHAIEAGSRGHKRQTGFAARNGQQMFDTRFSLYDDATLPDRPYSSAVDHEGTPGQRTTLIERGVLKGYYHTLHTAAQIGARSTGNGWRSMMEPPRPTLTNVVVERGEARLADMMKGLEDGLLIDMVMSSDGSVGLRGDFSRTVALAYRVKRGRLTGYVRGVGAAGNLYRSLSQIEALGREGFWSDHISAPYIQLGGVTITA
jgi:PmbA protein